MRRRGELPQSAEQAEAEGWRYLCHEVDLDAWPPDGVVVLQKGRRMMAIPFTTIEHQKYRFEEAGLVSRGAANATQQRKWVRKSEKLMQLRRSQIETGTSRGNQ